MQARVIQSFSELSADDHAYIYCLVVSVKEKTGSNGKPYLDVKASDGVGTFSAKVWNTTLADTPMAEGAVVYARVSASMYMGHLQYVLSRIEPKPDLKADMFLASAPIDVEAAFKAMYARANKMRSPLREIVCGLLSEHADELKHAAAGRTFHHSYIGGLLYHCYRMSQSAESLSRIYKNLDCDMVVAGTMLHDIGKLKELDTDWKGNVEYTVSGAMFGHLFFGTKMVMDKAAELHVDDTEDAMLLAHIIASHHGQQELGALKEPLTREALVVHQLDVLDMKQTIFDESLESMGSVPGTMTPKFAMFDYGAYYPIRGHES